MKVPVYIDTNACTCIGTVDIDSPDQFDDAADKLWKSQDYDTPSLCHQCATFDLGDWGIANGNLDYYFKPKK